MDRRNLEAYARWYVAVHSGVRCLDPWAGIGREYFDWYYTPRFHDARLWLESRRFSNPKVVPIGAARSRQR